MGQWSLVATASRAALQAPDLSVHLPATLLPSNGESRRATLTFEWRRTLTGDTVRAGAFAGANALALHSGALAAGDNLWERMAHEDRRTRIGAYGSWSGFARIAGLGFLTSARGRAQGESLETQGRLERASGEAPTPYLDDRMRQSFAGLDFSAETQPIRGLRATAAVALERYRFDVATRRDYGNAVGSLVSPRIELSARPRGTVEYFASLGRGSRTAQETGPGAAVDPRDGTPLARLEPNAQSVLAEAGWRTRIRGVETRVSAWRASTPYELTLLEAGSFHAGDRPTARQGATLSARHEPAPWLSLEIDATALQARYRDGARERVRGASERQVNAGATVRNGSKWSASLFVKYLGERPAMEEDALRLRSSTTVGAQFTTRLDRRTRLTVDVFNVFNQRAGDVDYFAASRLWSQPGTVDGFLFHPAAPRGFRALLSTRF